MIDNVIKILEKEGKMSLDKHNQIGLHDDLDCALFQNNLKEIKGQMKENHELVCEIQAPKEIQSKADLNKIAFRLFAEIAEDFQIIESNVEKGKISYDFLMGGKTHIHKGTLIFSGENITKITENCGGAKQ